QMVAVSGNVYRLAEATINNPTAFTFGNVHVGDTLSQAVSISNTAMADSFSEKLNASFGAASDVKIQNNGGSFSLLDAGSTDSASMTVSVNTGTAGAVNGTQTINFVSDGAGTSGLGQTGLPSQNLTVTANIQAGVYALADPVINNSQPVAFGKHRVGDLVANQALSITNNGVNDGFHEALNAQGGTGTNNGSFNLLTAGDTDNSSITVGIDTSTAGNKAGMATVAFESDGTGTSGLGITNLPSQNVNITGEVYRLAQGNVSPNPIVMHARVGDSAQQTVTVSNTAANDGYSESLAVSSSATGDAQLAGSISGLIAAQGSDSSLVASLDTATSGAKSGTLELAFSSDGAGTSGLAAIASGSSSVAVSGNVWQTAQADVQPTSIDFGIVHVGDVVTQQSVGVTNTASGALVDVLRGGFTQVDGPFNGSGDLGSGVASGVTNTSMGIGLNTSSSGSYSSNAVIGLNSHNDDLVDLALSSVNLQLEAQVNEYANPVFDHLAGDGLFSGSGTSYLIDFGSLLTGVTVDATFAVLNDVVGIADLLDGTFDTSGQGSFGASSFNDFFNLMAGVSTSDMMVSLDTTGFSLGLVQGSITLNALGHNASGYSGAFAPITLTMRARVVDGSVPEPGSLILILLGIFALLYFRSQVQTAKRESV
ncbi:MAG: choice-of-anchor D domain-containing protein, partial [Sedimenticola sp.]|nr:choice-of-anchor D domain-containing protein [Sedimenticola sp.]